MNKEAGSGSHSTILDPAASWWLEPGLAQLAFGSRPARPSGNATGATAHLAFLPPEAIEIDLQDPQQRCFGDYELLELMGQGGMGVVYRARQKSLARDVAVKLLSAGPWASPDFIHRFEREAQSAARMQHPNIVAIHEIGAHEELNFFSMQLVPGGSLARKISTDGPMPAREAARMLKSIAEAVDYAHRLGVLHLDLKPGNVLLDENGEPQVADFGLAKRLDEALAADSTEVSGTPSYMAPEQARVDKQTLSAATDIYGLGAILYECLTGRPPFTGSSVKETLRQVANEVPRPPRELQRAIPRDLEAICLKCLAKEPAQRYPNARALVEDLGRFLEGRETRALPLNIAQRSLRFSHREPKLVAALALVLFTLAMGFGASWLQWQRAERNAADARGLLWEGRREAALQLERNGEGMDAMPKLLANLAEQETAGDHAAAALERRRIGVLEAGGAQLLDAIAVADANPLAVALSPEGSRLVVSFSDQSVRWYDTRDFRERGRLHLGKRTTSDGEPRPILMLRFIDVDHVIATGEWYDNEVNPAGGDSLLLDLRSASVLEPPSAFADFADAAFSDNGRYAVLRDSQGRSQLWQVHPWRALSGFTKAVPTVPWLVDPQGRFVAELSPGMGEMRVHSTEAFDAPRTLLISRSSGVSAWAITRDGALMALGDFNGRMMLLDPATFVFRKLPGGRGRRVAWTAFSEDDAWVASGTRDGNVSAYDVASGDIVSSGTLKVDFAVQRVAIDHAHRLLLAFGEGRTALWRLSPPGPLAAPAQRLGLAPARHGMVARFPIDWSPASGLMASAGLDGQMRLWRLPAPVMSRGRAASQVADQFFVDANAVVDVAWDQVRVLPLDGGRAGPWLRLPQPPGFAEFVDGGRHIALTIGPQLQLYDAANLRAAAAPQELPATPERFATDAAGRRIAMVFGESGVDGFQERVLLFDAHTGKPLPGEVRVPGPLRRLQFSADGTRLLTVGPPDASTQVFAIDRLRPLGEYPHDPYQPVVWADFDEQGKQLRMVTRAVDTRLGGNGLVTWNIDEDKETALPLPGNSPPIAVISLDRGHAFVAATEGDWFVGTKLGELLPAADRDEATSALALSADGRLVAHASRRQVQLFDVASGTAVGLPLRGDGDASDIIARLAFAPDGRSLFARTLLGRWLRWPIAPESRPVATLAADVAAVAVTREDQRVVRMPGPHQRAAWRALDPGPWPAEERRPGFREQVLTNSGYPIPARSAGTNPALLDLGTSYDVAPEEVRSVFYNVRPTLRPMPFGLQRIGGQWFDIRGMAQIGFTDEGVARRTVELRCVPVGDTSVAAIHPLLLFSMPHPAATGTVLGDLTLHYSDGGSADLPIVAGRDVRGYGTDDRQVPLAFAADIRLSLMGLRDDVFSAPRLANPEPTRPVRCLDLRARLRPSPMALLAATLEAPAGAPAAAAATTP